MARGPRNPQKYIEARALRDAGTPYKRIAAALNISPATALAWTGDIELTSVQEERNRRGPNGPQNPEARRRRAAAWAARCRARRAAYQQEGRERARSQDPLHRMGCMLYWAEGGKSRNQVKFANSDHHMVRLVRTFLTDVLAIEPDEICLSVNAYTNNGLSIDEIERFWLNLLDVPPSSLRKATVNHMPTSSSGRARNRLRYGVCSLVVNRTRAVQHIYGAIQEYGGFEEPSWLD